jgi:hypothetical protein
LELRSGRNPVLARHLDVHDRYVRLRRQCYWDHLIAPSDLGDHLDVVFELQQAPDRSPEHQLVLS